MDRICVLGVQAILEVAEALTPSIGTTEDWTRIIPGTSLGIGSSGSLVGTDVAARCGRSVQLFSVATSFPRLSARSPHLALGHLALVQHSWLWHPRARRQVGPPDPSTWMGLAGNGMGEAGICCNGQSSRPVTTAYFTFNSDI